MWAVLAVVAFLLALVFHIAGGNVTQYVLDAALLGAAFTALHMAWNYTPWRKP